MTTQTKKYMPAINSELVYLLIGLFGFSISSTFPLGIKKDLFLLASAVLIIMSITGVLSYFILRPRYQMFLAKRKESTPQVSLLIKFFNLFMGIAAFISVTSIFVSLYFIDSYDNSGNIEGLKNLVPYVKLSCIGTFIFGPYVVAHINIIKKDDRTE